MKVILLKDLAGNLKAGIEYECADFIAKQLIRSGHAEAIETATKKNQCERATLKRIKQRKHEGA